MNCPEAAQSSYEIKVITWRKAEKKGEAAIISGPLIYPKERETTEQKTKYLTTTRICILQCVLQFVVMLNIETTSC